MTFSSVSSKLARVVDQVERDRAETVATGRAEQRFDLLEALHAIDGALHLRIEILNAEAQTVETEIGDLGDAAGVDRPGIDLYRELTLVGVAEAERVFELADQV